MSNRRYQPSYFRGSFTERGLQAARTYLNGATRHGNNRVYHTPFGGLRSTWDFPHLQKAFSKMQSEWDKILLPKLQGYDSLKDYEIHLRDKAGPMSYQKPVSERFDDIQAYYDDIHVEGTPISEEAVQDVVNEFSFMDGLRQRSLYQTNLAMKKSTSSGAPYQAKKRLVQDKVLKGTVSKSLRYDFDSWEVDLPTDGIYNIPALLGWRGQEGGPNLDDVKQRVVWMFPYSINLLELSIYQPAIQACQTSGAVAPWISMDAVDDNITALFDSKNKEDLIVCTDFTRFDQHFNEHMRNCARAIFEGLHYPKKWLEEVFPIKYHIPMICGVDQIYTGEHGMGSGSGGTNFDETIAHRALQYECARTFGSKLNQKSMCLGDDGILTYPGIDVAHVVQVYSSHGLEMNPSKQSASPDYCEFLRRWHHVDYRDNGRCVGVYSTHRALGRLCWLERFMDPDVWSAKAVALRELSILENIKYHPCKEDFVEFCIKRDKFRLGIDIPGFLDNIGSYAREVQELMPDFLGYTKSQQRDAGSGIEDWWITKYLKKIR